MDLHISGVRSLPCSSFTHAPRWRGPRRCIKQPAQVEPGPLTDEISIVSGGAYANRFGCTTIQETQIVDQILQDVCRILKRGLHLPVSKDLVKDDIVVSRPGSPLDCGVGLQEEI